MTSAVQIRLTRQAQVLAFIKSKQADMQPDSPAIRQALMRVGMLISNQAKINIRRNRLIDTGRLLNSIRWEFFTPDGGGSGIYVGSFGVPYAAVWEFGFHGIVQVKPHYRLITEAFGRVLQRAKRVSVRGHPRMMNVVARPYLKPAYEYHRDTIARILAEAFEGEQ